MFAALGEPLALGLAAGLGLLFVAHWAALRRPRARIAPRPGRKRSTRVVATSARRAGAATSRAVRRGGAAAGAGGRAAARRVAAPGEPRRWAFVAAIAVGAALRLAWVIVATRTPTGLRDPAEYLRIAVAFSHGDTLRFGGGGDPSAFWPPGYPALLTPFVWAARQTGGASTAFTASLVNVVAGTATIALAGILAQRWLGPRARNPAAWLVALCPGLVFWTSTPHTETAFTPFFLGSLVAASIAADRPSTRRWVLVGVLAGVAFLVRSPGVIGLAAPALALRAQRGSWRGVLRPTLIVAGVAVAVLVPWTVRNGLQVGLWSPASTNNAGAVCFGHHDDALALWEPEKLSQEMQLDCYGGSPYDDQRFAELYERSGGADTSALQENPDEAAWYRAAMGKGIGWALTHPLEEASLETRKLWETWSSEGRVIDGARNYEDPGWAGRWQGRLEALADWWGWVVGVLALLGLALVPACRRALPVWVPIAAYTLAILGGVVDPHYRYPVVPLVAVLAGGAVVHRRPAADPRDDPLVGEHGRSTERTTP